jgi:hypothetical protein
VTVPKGGARPGSGRPRGSRNKRTLELISLLDGMGIDPARELLRLGRKAEESGDLDLATRTYGVLMRYRWPMPTASSPAPETSPQPATADLAVELPSWWRPGRAS